MDDVRISLWPNRIKMLGKLTNCLNYGEIKKLEKTKRSLPAALIFQSQNVFKV